MGVMGRGLGSRLEMHAVFPTGESAAPLPTFGFEKVDDRHGQLWDEYWPRVEAELKRRETRARQRRNAAAGRANTLGGGRIAEDQA
jgi:hypothetical protein